MTCGKKKENASYQIGAIVITHFPSAFVRLFVVRSHIGLCLHSSIYKCQPIRTKLGAYVYDHKISDEFDYGTNRTRTVRDVCS